MKRLAAIGVFLQTIFEAITTLGINQGKKIDLKAEAIIARAEKKAEKSKQGTGKIRKKVTKEQLFAEVDLLGLRHPKRVKKAIASILTAGGELELITISDTSVTLKYTHKGRTLFKTIEQ